MHESVLADALADYKVHPELYTERVTTLRNLLTVLQGKCTEAIFSKADVIRLKDILERFNELGACNTGAEVRAFVDDLSAHLEQHLEYRDAGYRRLSWEIENEIIGAYMEVFCRASRTPNAAYQLSLLVAMDDLFVYAYPPDFLYYDMGIDFRVLTPENLLQESDPVVLCKKLNMLRAALGRWDVTASNAYVENFTREISAAVLNKIQAQPEWEDVSEAYKLRAKYLADLLRDELRGLTESLAEQAFGKPKDNYCSAQLELHKLCIEPDTFLLENDWNAFLVYAASSPDLDALSVQAMLALTVSLLAEVETDTLPETLQCLIRILLTTVASPVSFVYNDDLFHWILHGDAK